MLRLYIRPVFKLFSKRIIESYNISIVILSYSETVVYVACNQVGEPFRDIPIPPFSVSFRTMILSVEERGGP